MVCKNSATQYEKTIILACGLVLELAAIYDLEKKFNQAVKQACEFYNVATLSEGLIDIFEQSRDKKLKCLLGNVV